MATCKQKTIPSIDIGQQGYIPWMGLNQNWSVDANIPYCKACIPANIPQVTASWKEFPFGQYWFFCQIAILEQKSILLIDIDWIVDADIKRGDHIGVTFTQNIRLWLEINNVLCVTMGAACCANDFAPTVWQTHWRMSPSTVSTIMRSLVISYSELFSYSNACLITSSRNHFQSRTYILLIDIDSPLMLLTNWCW